METLPLETVLEISQLLTPKDLSHCCGVSRLWREIFGQDVLWQSHCDPSVEEHLRTTPSIVEPVFVTPGGEESTLSPISPLRLTFLKENHILNNWKHNRHKTEMLSRLDGELKRTFLTNTLVVRCCETHIEVWDVSVVPSEFIAKTGNISDLVGFSVADGNLLVVEQSTSVKVLFVDIINNQIQLKHDISLNDVIGRNAHPYYMDQITMRLNGFRTESNYLNCVKKKFFIHVNTGRLSLDIYNIETGEKVKEEFCPEISGQEKPKILSLQTTATTDYIVVFVRVRKNARSFYVYNPEKLCFLLGPIAAEGMCSTIHNHYFAIGSRQLGIEIYDCHTKEVLLKLNLERSGWFYSSGSDDYYVLNPPTLPRHCVMGAGWRVCFPLEMFSLTKKTWKTIPGFGDIEQIAVFNNKCLALVEPESQWYFLSGEEWVMCDISFSNANVNQACTKVISQESVPMGKPAAQGMGGSLVYPWCIHHYW